MAPTDRISSEKELLRRVAEGDESAYATLYSLHVVALTGFVESKLYSLEDARDIVQELFVELWARRATLSLTGTLQSYLYAAARHRIIDHIRKNLVREQYADRLRQLSPAFRSLEEELDARELAADIANKLAELPESTRTIYQLSREEGKTTREIAETLNISEQTVKNNISKALKHLRTTIRSLSFLFF